MLGAARLGGAGPTRLACPTWMSCAGGAAPCCDSPPSGRALVRSQHQAGPAPARSCSLSRVRHWLRPSLRRPCSPRGGPRWASQPLRMPGYINVVIDASATLDYLALQFARHASLARRGPDPPCVYSGMQTVSSTGNSRLKAAGGSTGHLLGSSIRSRTRSEFGGSMLEVVSVAQFPAESEITSMALPSCGPFVLTTTVLSSPGFIALETSSVRSSPFLRLSRRK
jgi:hypothetical protein